MNDFKFVSEEYSIHKSKNYRLSIQLNPDGFSVLVVNEERKVLKILHVQSGSYEESFKLFKSKEELIKLRELSFKFVQILLNNERVSLVPNHDDYHANFKKYFYIDFVKQKESRVLNRVIDNSDISCVYEIDETLDTIIQGFRNNPSVRHIGPDILSGLLSENNEKNIARVYTSPGLIHLGIASAGKMEFYNVFKWTTEEEMLFYLMNTLRKYNIEDLFVEYSGHIKKNGSAIKLLKKYIPGIHILPNVFSFEIAWDINENYFSYLYPNKIANY
ncbi:MAG: DUF3822 family protein [Bacteroidales bacterium]